MPEENAIYNLPPIQENLTADDVRAIVTSMMLVYNMPTKIAGGFLQSSNFATGVTGWQLRPDGAEINGGVSVLSLNIPDQTTANSFHVDSTGNAWWGANVASGYAGANAYILNTGGAVFKNVQIGGTTVQYVITNSGIFSYGDGSDGDVTISANTTLTRDMYYRNLTVSSGAVVNTGGYRIFCSVSLTMTGSSRIHQDGNAGGNAVGQGGGSTSGTPGAALAAGYFKATPAGGGEGSAGGSVTHALGGVGGSGGTGGEQFGPGHVGGAGGGAGTAPAANVKLIANWHLSTLLDIDTGVATATGNTALFMGGSSGGGGGFAGNGGFGRGGGGGGAAGIVAIYAKSITIGAGSSITATGGNGGTGSATGGGGGGGGAGGIVILVYNALVNSGSITAAAGTGGTGGAAGSGPGTFVAVGVSGSDGSAGVIYQFQLSL